MSIDAVGTLEDGLTGWKFQGKRDPKAGFYLKDISHDGHYFADSIRVERVAVAGFSEGDYNRRRDQLASHHVFGLGDCTEVSAPTFSDLKKNTKDPLGYYAPKVKVTTKYEMTKLVTETDQKIEFDLEYLFTPYNKDPSHEPGGILPAARIYPTLTFRVPEVRHKKKNPEYRRATAVQALFRINFKLDDRGTGNQCGLFADLEDLSAFAGLESAWNTHFKPGSFTFLQAEKPVLFDVVGRGIAHGTPSNWYADRAGWDNIHQYSHPVEKKYDLPEWLEKGVKQQPATPGLPYGAHLHWRWGAGAVAGATKLPGGKQYGGPQGPGTPLIDDKIRDQNIEFAIVDRDGWFTDGQEKKLLKAIDQDPVSYLFRDFSDVWDYMGTPTTIMPSGDLVIWLSLTAWSPGFTKDAPDYKQGTGKHTDYYLPEWGGTLFPQGIFFPHEDDSYLDWTAVDLIPGGSNAQYLPGLPSKTWRR